VAKIANRTASKHLRGSRDVIGHGVSNDHVSNDHLILHMSFPIGGPLERSL